jgi:hypothetical protein
MPCNIASLTDISFDCDALYTGGLKEVYISQVGDYTIATPTGANGSIATADITAPAVGDIVSFEFNLRDAVSNLTDVTTNNADGTSTTVPTITLEFPRMDAAKREALDAISKPGVQLAAAVKTAAGTYHLVGNEFGLYASSIDGASGTQRSEKNRYQLTLVGDENTLSLNFEDDAAFAAFIANA